MKFAFIEEQKVGFSVKQLCQVGAIVEERGLSIVAHSALSADASACFLTESSGSRGHVGAPERWRFCSIASRLRAEPVSHSSFSLAP